MWVGWKGYRCCGIRVTGYGIRVTGYGLRVTSYGLRVTSYELRVAGCGLRVVAPSCSRPSGCRVKFQVPGSRFQVSLRAVVPSGLKFQVSSLKCRLFDLWFLRLVDFSFFIFYFLLDIGYWILVIVRLLRLGYSFQISVALSIRKFFISSSGTG